MTSKTRLPRTLADLPKTPTARWDKARRSRPPSIPLNDADFDAARALFESDDLIRGQIEARLLAYQPIAIIAQKTSIPESVLASYQHWFYDIWPRLPQSEWIHAHAIGRRSPDSLQRDEVAAFWRSFAYKNPFAIDTLLSSVAIPELERLGLEAYLRVCVALPLSTKLTIAGELEPNLKALEKLDVLAGIANLPSWKKQLTSSGMRTSVAESVVRLFIHANRRRQEIAQGPTPRRRRSIKHFLCFT